MLELHYFCSMIIYSVTIALDPRIENDWVRWMKEKHIPDVMNTGCFVEKRMTKVVEGAEEGTINYNVQYVCASQDMLDQYHNDHAPALQQEHGERYTDKFIAFRTVLEIID